MHGLWFVYERNGAKNQCWRQQMRSQKKEMVTVNVTGTNYTYITRNQYIYEKFEFDLNSKMSSRCFKPL